jgi:hypothetical protein
MIPGRSRQVLKTWLDAQAPPVPRGHRPEHRRTRQPVLAAAAIWQRLSDDHGTTVAYPTLRTYVVGRRSAPTS